MKTLYSLSKNTNGYEKEKRKTRMTIEKLSVANETSSWCWLKGLHIAKSYANAFSVLFINLKKILKK